MLKDFEPRKERTWTFDNEFHPQSETGRPIMFRWSFEGEVGLSLLVIREPNMRRFEMARNLEDQPMIESMATHLVQDALTAISNGDKWVDVFWVGLSPEELEDFCQERYLPLPLGYKEAWIALE